LAEGIKLNLKFEANEGWLRTFCGLRLHRCRLTCSSPAKSSLPIGTSSITQHPYASTFRADCSTTTPESSTEVPGRCSMPACRTREECDQQACKNYRDRSAITLMTRLTFRKIGTEYAESVFEPIRDRVLHLIKSRISLRDTGEIELKSFS